MSMDAVIPKFARLTGANLMAVEHAELVVALHAAVTALDANGLHQEASAARAVLQGMAIRAVSTGLTFSGIHRDTPSQ
jgi:hypothetical protein